MTEPRIPTMPCHSCGGTGRGDYWSEDDCDDCGGTGRIPRPPLSPEEVAALPDGARVVFEYEDPPCVLRGIVADDLDRAIAEGLVRISRVRVWLAAEDSDA